MTQAQPRTDLEQPCMASGVSRRHPRERVDGFCEAEMEMGNKRITMAAGAKVIGNGICI